MLSRCALSILVLVVSLASPLTAEPVPDTAPLTPRQIDRLAAVARLWGQVKYFHPYIGSREIDWDGALLDALPKLEAATSESELRTALEALLAPLGDPLTRTLPAGETVLTEDERIGQPPLPTAEPPAKLRLEWLPGRIAYLDARRAGALVPMADHALLAPLVEEARAGKGLILDLRVPVEGHEMIEFYMLTDLVQSELPSLVRGDVVLPALRTRFHDGYAPQNGTTSGGYSSGVIQREHGVLHGTATRPIPKWVILTSDDSAVDPMTLAGLELAGLATVIHSGKLNPYTGVGGLTVAEGIEGIKVALRLSEAVTPDGRTGLVPSFTLPPASTASGTEDAARALALEVLRGNKKPTPTPLERHVPRVRAESRSEGEAYPPRGLRMLALFRFWNVIDRFFPYDSLIDRPWDGALTDFLPRFAEASDALGYHLTVAELVTRIQDTHGFITSPILQEYFGTARPPLTVRSIEDRWVITVVLDEELEQRGEVRAGDVVVSIDGEAAEARAARIGRYIAASTPQALRWRVASWLLAGARDQELTLLLEGADGARREIRVARQPVDPKVAQARTTALRPGVFTRLPSGFGYMDLPQLEMAQVPEAFELVRETPGLILDMRGYPKGTAWSITPYLSAESRDAAKFRRPMLMTPEAGFTTDYAFVQPFPGGGPWQYQGKLVVLIDERAISQAEHSCLFFESARPDVTFIGSPTNGANGDVTNVPLPGGILVRFSGHDVRHADGEQLQRRGIQPDLWVTPTIAGLRAGRDEVLEAAVAFLEKETRGAVQP